MSRSIRLALAALLAATPAALAAQQAANATPTNGAPAAIGSPSVSGIAPVAVSDQPASLAPTSANAAVGARPRVSDANPAPAPAPLPRRADTSRNKALMIVGAAAFVAGVVIDESSHTAGALMMVGGAVIGLYGLYKYLE